MNISILNSLDAHLKKTAEKEKNRRKYLLKNNNQSIFFTGVKNKYTILSAVVNFYFSSFLQKS